MTRPGTYQTGSAVRPDVAGIVDDDEAVLDSALASAVFHWLSKSILLSPSIAREEFYLRRFHALLTDVLVQMPLKVKELRNRADDAARNKLMHEQEGIQFNVPLQGQHFEQLMCSVAQLYSPATSTHSQVWSTKSQFVFSFLFIVSSSTNYTFYQIQNLVKSVHFFPKIS